MNGFLKRFAVVLFAAVMAVSSMILVSAESKQEVTVLFTHDLHSHFLPSRDEDGGEFGGYARLMTAINEEKEKHPDAILLDGGDFSMGSLFQTCFTTDALELRMMGLMGYDVTTLGNHEFDYLPEGLASMLNTAKESKERLPQIVDANYLPPEKGEDGYNEEISKAFENYGIKRYTLIERGGVCFAVFGIFGTDSDACAPNSGMVMEDAAQISKEVIAEATKECKDKYGLEPVVICLSHSGTEDGKGEDYRLAESVDGIDLIVSGHTHTTFDSAVKVNDTYIVSAGEYGKNLGVVKMSFDGDSASLTDYRLVSIDENIEDDPAVAAKVQEYKEQVDANYLAKYGVSFDEVIVNNPYKFDSVDEVYATQHDSDLGNIFADSYKKAVENATGKPVDVALTAAGVIRETLPQGKVTVSDIFNAASLGVGTEGELIKVYITGKELKAALEVDASVQPIMSAAQLFFSGVEYSFNTNRMIFNKVDKACLVRNDGTKEEINDDKLYSVVTGMYAGQMLGSVKEKSFGLLSITPRDENGNPIDAADLKNYVVYDGDKPLKEWYAITSYLKDMNGEISRDYESADGRKTVYSSFAPTDLLRNANVFTFAVIGAVLVLLSVIVLVTVLVVRKIKKRKNK